jgi:flavin reductase (DIM6/NTAB) family NADH-FMN oxidoreductase RutF
MVKQKLGAKPYLFPMPCTLIGAQVEGKPNFMMAAFVGIMNSPPPMIGCGLSPKHYTCKGIEANKTFSVNVPSEAMVAKADYCGLTSGRSEDKSKLFEVYYGELKTAPLIQECPISLECSLVQTIPLGNDTLYLGEIKEIYCEENAMTQEKPDVKKIKPFVLTFPDNGLYSIGPQIGTGWKTGKNYKPKV